MKTIIAVIAEFPRDEFWLKLSIESYKNFADHIVIVDGSKGESDEDCETGKIITEDPDLIENFIDQNFILDDDLKRLRDKFSIIPNTYPHQDKGADGKQRNKYLDFIKDKFPGDLCVVVDSDEVLADNAEEQIEHIKKTFIENTELDIYNPRMEHFINDFGHVDSTLDFHFCPHRIFKISKDLKYPEVEHVFLKSEERKLMVHQSNIIATTILYYHYAYVKGKEDIIEKYEKHMSKSNIHTTKFLDWWKHSHLFGSFPVKDFIGKHPKPVREKFKL